MCCPSELRSLLFVRVAVEGSGYRKRALLTRKGSSTCEVFGVEQRDHIHAGGDAAQVRARGLRGDRLGAEADGCGEGDARLRPRGCQGKHNGADTWS